MCNESISQTWDEIHILLLAEKRALTKHPIRGEKWFMGIKSHVSFFIYGHILQVYCTFLDNLKVYSDEVTGRSIYVGSQPDPNSITWDSWKDMKKNWSLIRFVQGKL